MDLDTLLARQAGVLCRAQARAAGLSGAAIDHRLRTRRWHPLLPRVYLADGYALDDRARVRAAVLWAGTGAVLSGRSAAWWCGLLPAAPTRVTVVAPVRRAERAGIGARCRSLAAADRTWHGGLPVTALGLTVLEAAVELSPQEGEQLLHRALRRGLDPAAVLDAQTRHRAPVTRLLAAAAAARDLRHHRSSHLPHHRRIPGRGPFVLAGSTPDVELP